MKGRTLYFLAPVVLLLVVGLLVPQGAMAATTGKLTGRVTDASTGEPLPGVNVVIEGTQRGGTSDADGYYQQCQGKLRSQHGSSSWDVENSYTHDGGTLGFSHGATKPPCQER